MSLWLYSAAIAWGTAYGLFFLARKRDHWRAAAKTIAVTLLAATALLSDQPVLLVLALALSALGDFFLAYEGEANFLAGLVSFLLAQIAYCTLFFAGQSPLWSGSIGFFAGTIAIFAFALAMFRQLRRHLGKMRLPVTLYTGILSAMAVAALSRGPDPLLLSGVTLLLASDAVLAYERFVFETHSPHRRWSGPVIWFTYLIGQALVLATFLFG